MASIIDSAGLGALVTELRGRGFTVVGPTLRDNAIVLAEIDDAGQLPHGWGVDTGPGTYRVRPRTDRAAFGHSAGPGSWKQFLHPARQRVWSSDGPADEPPPRYAFLGVRACDLAAIGVLDRVLVGGAHPDGAYAGRRDGVFIVAVNCTEPGGLCFCASMNTGPACRSGYDLALTELIDGQEISYLVETGTDEGAELLDAVPHRSAEPAQVSNAADQITAAAGAGPAAAARRRPRFAALGRRCESLLDLRQLHDGLPDLLLHQHLRGHRPDRTARRAVDGVGVVFRVGLHLRP